MSGKGQPVLTHPSWTPPPGSFDVNKIQRDLTRLGNKMDMILNSSPHTKGLVSKIEKKKMLGLRIGIGDLRLFVCLWF